MKVLYMTGYKAFEFGIFKNDHEAVKYIKKAMKQRLLPLLEDGLEWVIISGQLGTMGCRSGIRITGRISSA
jgi:uncharacterized phage-like protein YoqJ